MIAIGLFQVSLGVTGGDAVYTAIAAVYALVGVAYLWFEVYTAE